ncbi:MAG: PDZ domain-containing protein [Planctomycetaceae bacterium]|jgi:hypothetical protein|nr:PDZ domain-containing protein [Planctomycetaceae bacterium]
MNCNSPRSSIVARLSPAVLVICVLPCLGAQAADPRRVTGDLVDPPLRGQRRSHIQSVGELAAAAQPDANQLGLRLSRASTVLRQQLALARGAGLVVDEVAPGSRAARAGFQQHDVLVMLDDQLLLLPEQLTALLEAAGADAPLHCTVLRGGRKVKLPLASDPPAAHRPATAGLRPTASTLALVRESRPQPAPNRAAAPAEQPARLARISSETLLRQDPDYQIRLTGGEETRVVVTDNQGRVVFNDTIDTPEGRSRMPMVVRQRVEEMEKALERQPVAEIGRLDVAPIELR